MGKLIYRFTNQGAKKVFNSKEILGGKGANLAQMAKLGLPVPPGFTISTKVCEYFYKNNKKIPKKVIQEAKREINVIEKISKKKFGDLSSPLLVSVRSGSRVSMPGMMDTILNLGLNDKTVIALKNETSNGRFAKDSYRRLIQMYGNVVLGIELHFFEELIENFKLTKGVIQDTELDEEDWDGLIKNFKEIVKQKTKKDFPQDINEQLWGAIRAVFLSWNSKRAKIYRKINYIPDNWGTAVNVQAMVFGNMGKNCATGVAFTRNPSTGEREFFGEYLINAQGEDVVAGTRTPQYISKKLRNKSNSKDLSMEETMPKIFQQLKKIIKQLEKKYRDMQDIEFTVENNKLWMLQTRSGKRTAKAAIKIAVDMVKEKLISNKEAILRVDPNILDTLLHPTLDEKAEKRIIASGLPASPGAASGKVVFSADEAERLKEQQQNTILVRVETSPEDINGMHAANGILTARGGMTSHAAVIARGMGKPCVSGSNEIKINYENKFFKSNEHIIKEGDIITIDGASGKVMLGEVPTVKPDISGDFSKLMSWADQIRKLKVRANSETPSDTKIARDFGAEGIGLCRTEHMFFDEKRIISVRQMILSKTLDDRKVALAKLLPYQRNDFVKIFKIMNGLPVTVRLLDPPLNEFLPHTLEEMEDIAKAAGVDITLVKARKLELDEANPMLGHRGCRLGIVYPEITKMQATAIFEAASEVQKKKIKVLPEIMVPLVSYSKELELQKAVIDEAAKEVRQKHGLKANQLKYVVGTMIEIPRAALTASEVAVHAEFFSFRTNDLTQTCLGLSRDDSSSFLPAYQDAEVLSNNPFASLDQTGVGQLVEMGVKGGRKTKKNLKIGICGEHGGDPSSIEFCARAGLNYISCSPYRVPVARLAAAQANLLKK